MAPFGQEISTLQVSIKSTGNVHKYGRRRTEASRGIRSEDVPVGRRDGSRCLRLTEDRIRNMCLDSKEANRFQVPALSYPNVWAWAASVSPSVRTH